MFKKINKCIIWGKWYVKNTKTITQKALIKDSRIKKPKPYNPKALLAIAQLLLAKISNKVSKEKKKDFYNYS